MSSSIVKNICVFSSSSNSLDERFYSDAIKTGVLLGKSGYNVVYGGSKLGIMYKTAHAAKENGAKIIGIMPEKLYDLGFSENFYDEFHLTKGMRERKALLDKKSEGILALPGGFGTLEEVSEMIVQKQLHYNNKPIVFLNTMGFYNNLLKFFDDIIQNHFANQNATNLYYVANTPEDAICYLDNYKAENVEFRKDDLLNEILNK